MTTYTTKKTAKLAEKLAQQEAENERRLAAIRAEQEAEEHRIAEAMDKAGHARVALVEDLLDMFDIEPTPHEPRRNKRSGEVLTDKDGKPRMVDPDPDETQRMERLRSAIEQLKATVAKTSQPAPPGAS